MKKEKLKKIVWEWGTAGVSNLEITQRLKEKFNIDMTEEKLIKFINDNFK